MNTVADTGLQATGTTLGADNGIGVCAALSLLSQPASVKLPPLEALFTVDEETGLTGAFELDASMLSGAQMCGLQVVSRQARCIVSCMTAHHHAVL